MSNEGPLRAAADMQLDHSQRRADGHEQMATAEQAAREFCSPCGGAGQPCCREPQTTVLGPRTVCADGARCVNQGAGNVPLCAACGQRGALCCSAPSAYGYDETCPVAAETLQQLSCSLIIEPRTVASLDSKDVCEPCGQEDQPCCRGALLAHARHSKRHR